MAVTIKKVQLHKKGNTDERWSPITTGDCVSLENYSKGNNSDAIGTSDDLNIALSKIENILDSKADKSDISTVYTAKGTKSSLDLLGGTTLPSGIKVGYVYNLSESLVIGSGNRTDFIEYVLDPTISKDIPVGSNVVVIKHTDNKYYYDVLATSSIVSGGSGTVNSGAAMKLAYYASSGTAVSAASGLTYDSATGSIIATGNVVSGTAVSSDKRLKDNIKSFGGLDIIDELKPVSFNWNSTAKQLSDAYEDGVNYGVIAQDAEGVIDNFVFDLPNGFKGVRYEKLIPVLLQAIKELKQEIDILKSDK